MRIPQKRKPKTTVHGGDAGIETFCKKDFKKVRKFTYNFNKVTCVKCAEEILKIYYAEDDGYDEDCK